VAIRQRQTRRLLFGCVSACGLVAAFTFGPVLAEDVVHVRTGDDGRGHSRMTGKIMEYTGDQLELKTASGRSVKIPAHRVVHIESKWTDEHVRADKLIGTGKWGEALDAYREALRQERRPWVQNMIRARSLHCCRNLGQIELACRLFLTLSRNDPASPYFHLMPLSWRPDEPTLSLAALAQTWSQNTESPAEALLGSSWLLPTAKRTSAIAVLDRLSTNSDRRIAQLAIAQLWRNQLMSATPEDVDRWRKVVRQIPEPMRAGPYFLVGKALARQKQHEHAALALLRVPILYGAERELAAESLWEAAGQLRRHGADGDAIGLYQELATAYPESPYADAARKELEGPEDGG
jgi:tetratricopeptide (TPR) repeat protein